MPTFGYALIVVGVLAFANWMQWKRGETLYEKAQQAAQKEEQAIADKNSLIEANARLEQVEAVRARELSKLRVSNEKLLRSLSGIQDDGCLNRPLPADVDRLLGPDAETDPPPTTDAGAKASPNVGRKDIPRPSGVRPPTS